MQGAGRVRQETGRLLTARRGNPADDPWGALDVEVTSLSDEQRAYLSATPTFDDGPIDPDLLAAADAEIIDIPDEGDIDPF